MEHFAYVSTSPNPISRNVGIKREIAQGYLEELSGRVATVEASPGLRRGLRRRGGTGGGLGKRGEVVGEGRSGFHLLLEVLPIEVVRMVLRLRLVLAGVLHFASCFFHFHGGSSPCFVVELARSTRLVVSITVCPSRGPRPASSSRQKVRRHCPGEDVRERSEQGIKTRRVTLK